MLYCYCVALLLSVSSYVLIVCTVPLPPGVNPIAVDKYIYLSISKSGTLIYPEPLGPPRPVAGHLYLYFTMLNVTLARLICKLPDDGRTPKHVGAILI